ncbi:MAG: hypothetical protein R3F59_12740 [Myxococcota bacterium]
MIVDAHRQLVAIVARGGAAEAAARAHVARIESLPTFQRARRHSP